MNVNSIRTDRAKEENGVWVSFQDAKIKICSKTSDRYKKVMQRLLGPVEIEIALGKLKEEDAEGIMIRGLAEGIILEWSGIEDDNGPVAYTADAAFVILRDVRFLRNFLDAESQKFDNFKLVKEGLEVKN